MASHFASVGVEFRIMSGSPCLLAFLYEHARCVRGTWSNQAHLDLLTITGQAELPPQDQRQWIIQRAMKEVEAVALAMQGTIKGMLDRPWDLAALQSSQRLRVHRTLLQIGKRGRNGYGPALMQNIDSIAPRQSIGNCLKRFSKDQGSRKSLAEHGSLWATSTRWT